MVTSGAELARLIDGVFAASGTEWTFLKPSDKSGWVHPTSDEALAALSAALGRPVPAPLESVLRVADGFGVTLALPKAAWTLLSAARVAEEWETMNEVAADLEPGAWDRGWIPVAAIGSGELLCVDTTAGERLVRVMRNPSDNGVEADGLEAWLRGISDSIARDEYVLVDRTLMHKSLLQGPTIACPRCGSTTARAVTCGVCGGTIPQV